MLRSASSRSLAMGSSPRLAGPSPRSPVPGLQALCPDLIVPERMELDFAVPEALGVGAQHLSFSILDMRGQPLSHVIANETGSPCGIQLQMLDRTPLAFIRTECLHGGRSGRGRSREPASSSGQGTNCIEICRPSGEVFCVVTKDEGTPWYRYVLRSKTWQRLYTYCGNFREKAVNVTNSSGHLVCTSERCRVGFDSASHYQVRVAPQTDAGLLLCGLLAIDKLEGGSQSS
uniref:Phospholipid scramblase n=1 Tax=Alexandrium catenella TaxID=2925 RepID=A0A7S1MQW9_ALECA